MKLEIKLAIVSGALVVTLTAVSRMVLSPLLFYSLCPGIALSLLITGGHGGTHFQDFIASALGVVINILAYFMVLLLVNKLMVRRKDRQGVQSGTSA